jgi:hypothetical protein
LLSLGGRHDDGGCRLVQRGAAIASLRSAIDLTSLGLA